MNISIFIADILIFIAVGMMVISFFMALFVDW